MMEFLGLILELLFLFTGIYVYLFARGWVNFKGEHNKARAEKFREDNKGWMRPLALLLIAVMALNIFIHISQFFG